MGRRESRNEEAHDKLVRPWGWGRGKNEGRGKREKKEEEGVRDGQGEVSMKTCEPD